MSERELRVLALHEPISITWSRYAPGQRGPDLHVHREHSDAFYVLEGELTFGLGPEGDRGAGAGGRLRGGPAERGALVRQRGRRRGALPQPARAGHGLRGLAARRRDGGDPSYDQFDPPADGGRPRSDAIVSGPGEGERLVSGNRIALMKGVLDDMSVAEWTIEGPLEGPGLHTHENGVDSFYVIEGELEMTVEGAVHGTGPGTLASVPPRRAPHVQPSRRRNGPLHQHPRARRGLRRTT